MSIQDLSVSSPPSYLLTPALSDWYVASFLLTVRREHKTKHSPRVASHSKSYVTARLGCFITATKICMPRAASSGRFQRRTMSREGVGAPFVRKVNWKPSSTFSWRANLARRQAPEWQLSEAGEGHNSRDGTGSSSSLAFIWIWRPTTSYLSSWTDVGMDVLHMATDHLPTCGGAY